MINLCATNRNDSVIIESSEGICDAATMLVITPG